MFVCSVLQNSYLPLAPHSDQFTVSLCYIQLARLSISLKTYFIQKSEGGFTLGRPQKHISTFWCPTFLTPCPGKWLCRAVICCISTVIWFSLVVLCCNDNDVQLVSCLFIFSICLLRVAHCSLIPILKVKGNINIHDWQVSLKKSFMLPLCGSNQPCHGCLEFPKFPLKLPVSNVIIVKTRCLVWPT